jgi:sulfur-oxidizing protein SoxA
MNFSKTGIALLMAACASASALAQKSAADGIAEYRAMLADGNPSDLFEAKGEGLWKQKRGP